MLWRARQQLILALTIHTFRNLRGIQQSLTCPWPRVPRLKSNGDCCIAHPKTATVRGNSILNDHKGLTITLVKAANGRFAAAYAEVSWDRLSSSIPNPNNSLPESVAIADNKLSPSTARPTGLRFGILGNMEKSFHISHSDIKG